MPHDPTAIRNVALVGHHGAGKTTLAEALLAATGSIARRGSVEKGSTVMDFEPEEVARQLSISTSLAPFTVNGVKVNLLDTPGYADFAGEMVTALANVDLAVVVVSATDGVQAQTEDAWRAAARLGVPRVIVINKLDRERADFDRTLAEIRASFGAGVAPVELPIGHEADFHGVIDLLDDTATHYDVPAAGAAVDGTVPPAGHEGPIPDDLVDEEHTVHEQLVEGIVVGDDDLMERYLNGETLDYAELEKSLAGGVASASVFPVLCCSAASGVGVDRLARLIEELCPSPASRPPVAGHGRDRDGRDPVRPGRPDAAHRDQDLQRRPHRQDVALQGGLGHAAARRRPRQPAHPGRGAAARAAEHRRPRHGAGDERRGRRLRGGAPPQRDAHRRHPGAQGPARRGAAAHAAGAGAAGGGEAGRRGPTTTSSCRRCTGCWTRTRR